MRAILPIQGVPDELLRAINDRLREIEALIQPPADPGAAVLPNIGTPGRFTAGTTDAKGRVVDRGRLQTSDLPGGGYPAVEPPLHSQFYSARSSSIGTVTVAVPAAGRYFVGVNLGATTSGAGTVAWSVSWTSNGTVRTIATSGLTLTVALTTSGISAVYPVNADAGTNITYSTTYVAPGAYEFTAAVVKV